MPLNEQQLERVLTDILTEHMGAHDEIADAHVISFRELNRQSKTSGVRLILSDGSKFNLHVRKS